MNGIGSRISGDDLQQIIREQGRRAVWRDLGKVPPRLGLNAAESVGRAAALILAVPQCHPARPHGTRRANVGMQHYRLFIHAHHRFLLHEWPFIESQNVFHARDVLRIQLRDAPHFFPATASDHGSPAGYGWFPGSLVAPASVSPLPRRSAAHSTAPCLAAANRKPWPRSAASAPCSIPARGLDVTSRTERYPTPRPRSAGRWRAPSSALRLRSRPPARPSAHRRAGAKWKPAATLALTPALCSTSRPPAAYPSSSTQHAHGDS